MYSKRVQVSFSILAHFPLQIPGISKSTVHGSNDKLIIAAVVMTAITLIITGLFWVFVCFAKYIWIYKVSNNDITSPRDQEKMFS